MYNKINTNIKKEIITKLSKHRKKIEKFIELLSKQCIIELCQSNHKFDQRHYITNVNYYKIYLMNPILFIHNTLNNKSITLKIYLNETEKEYYNSI